MLLRRCLALLSIIGFSLPFQVAQAQLEASKWYFGYNAGLDFSSGTPAALLDGAITTDEGCASISNENGELLFYTDGISVWNSDHTTMPNGFGLTGNPSSAQSGIIVPNPSDPNRYYVFSVAAQGDSEGLAWSEVDMSLNSGLGDVIAATKNTQLLTPSAEKIAAVQHADGTSVWVLAHGMYSGIYYAWLVDCEGIQPPVTSTVGQVEGFPGWGGISISPDGNRVGVAIRDNGFEIFDFDSSTGELSNPLVLYNPGFGSYGASFSPNSQVFYGCNIETGEIFQWDLSLPSTTAIIDSRITVGVGEGAPTGYGGYKGGTLQLGPDGKLYVPQVGQDYLSAIVNPDVVGMGCDFQPFHTNLNGRIAVLGLPPFIIDFLDTSAEIETTIGCAGTPSYFSTDIELSLTEVWTWDFAGQGTSDEVSPSFVFDTPGTYEVTLTTSSSCSTDTSSVMVSIPPADDLQVTHIELCAGDSIQSGWGLWYSNEGFFVDPTNPNVCEGGNALQIELISPDTSITALGSCGPVDWNGSVYSVSGQYQSILTNSFGCDSVATLDLSIIPPEISSTSISECDSLTWNEQTYYSTGLYEYETVAVSGCDSTAILDLTILPSTSSSTSIQACEMFAWNDEEFLDSGIYTFLSTNSFGCDSVAQLELEILNPVTSNTFAQTCDSLEWNGTTYNSSGTYEEIFTASNSCDSTAFLTLEILPSSTSLTTFEACGFYNWNGTNYTSSGQYEFVTTNVFGCDSLAQLDLEILNPDSTAIAVETCTSFFWQGDQLTSSGNYSAVLQNQIGCDSVVNLDLTVFPEYNFTLDQYACEPLEWMGLLLDNSGTYSQEYISQAGCDSTYTIDFVLYTPENPPLFEVESCGPFTWNGTEYRQTGIYTNVSLDDNGCELEETLALTVIEDQVFVPNAFTPDGDGVNDVLTIASPDNIELHFQIFDRWGNRIHDEVSLKPTWNGSVNEGQYYAANGTYPFILSFNCGLDTITRSGMITLIR